MAVWMEMETIKLVFSIGMVSFFGGGEGEAHIFRNQLERLPYFGRFNDNFDV